MRLRDLRRRQRPKRGGRKEKAGGDRPDRRERLGITGLTRVPTLLLTGPGGVGKTTLAFEVSRQLAARDVPHAMIDADELDRIFPALLEDPHKTRLTYTNLADVWANLRDAGARRLVLTMVALSLADELALVRRSIPEADVTVVRLRASEEDLLGRVRGREAGSGYGDHAPRTIEQARAMDRQADGGHLLVDTTDKPVPKVAREVLDRTGWPNG